MKKLFHPSLSIYSTLGLVLAACSLISLSACKPKLLNESDLAKLLDEAGPVAIAPAGLSYVSPQVLTLGSAANLAPTLLLGSAPLTYSATSLPSGLNINATTGVISGTPSATSASTSYTIQVSNSAGSTSFNIQIAVAGIAPSGLSYSSPQTLVIGASANIPATLAAGTTPLTYTAPSLPAGLSINASSGLISGTPTATSSASNYTITVTNAWGSTTFDINLAVNGIAPSGLSYSSPQVLTLGAAANLPATLATGTAPLTYSTSALPAGLGVHPSSGLISGTPTTPSAAATYTITVSNAWGSTTFDINLAVNGIAPSGLSYVSPQTLSQGAAVNIPATLAAGTPPLSYAAGSLPAGLSIDASSGLISGTPTSASAAANYTVSVTNAWGSTSFDINLTVTAGPPTGLAYTNTSVTQGASLGSIAPNAGLCCSVTSFAVTPAPSFGISFNTTTGTFSGTAAGAPGVYTYNVTATNAFGTSSAVAFQLTVVDDGGPFRPNDLPGVTRWFRASYWTGVGKANGDVVAEQSANRWVDEVQNFTSAVAIGTNQGGTYRAADFSGTPSVLICGTTSGIPSSTCSSTVTAPTRLRMASSLTGFDLLKGPDTTYSGSNCTNCGSSFTMTFLASRTSASMQYLIHNTNGAASPTVGPAIGWSSGTNMVFSTQGSTGTNRINVTVPAYSAPILQIITLRFSRTGGIKAWVVDSANPAIVQTDATKTTASEMNSLAMVFGHRTAAKDANAHIVEFMGYDRALSDTDVCSVHTYLNTTYSLGISNPCP